MITPEQAKTIVQKKFPEEVELGPVIDYKGHYIFAILDKKYIGHAPLGVNKLKGSVMAFNFMDPGLKKAAEEQYPY